MISIIVAMTKNRVIGVNGKLPWKRLKSDKERFKTLTTGHPVIMGRKTWDYSIPEKFRPLPWRTNIVVTRNPPNWRVGMPENKFAGAHTVNSIQRALQKAIDLASSEEIFIIGGAEIYKLFLPFADQLYITEVNAEIHGDSYFPIIDESQWKKEFMGSFATDENNDFAGEWYRYSRTEFPIVEPLNARNDEYCKQLAGILENGKCPFCPGGVTWQEQEVLLDNEHWILTRNAHSLKDTIDHVMVIPRRHITQMALVTVEEFEALADLIHRGKHHNGIVWYWREGNPVTTGATVQHLHLHGIVPNGATQVSFGMLI